MDFTRERWNIDNQHSLYEHYFTPLFEAYDLLQWWYEENRYFNEIIKEYTE